MTEIRDRARRILAVVPEIPGEVHSSLDGKTSNKAFTDITNTPHSTMKANWDKGGIMTACNGFVGWYGATLGSPGTLGVFELEAQLKKYGRHDAWVKSAPGVRPKFGDICRYTKYHVGVSLGFNGEFWCHVDAGQGGHKVGYDIIRRAQDKTPYTSDILLGWVDLDIYFGGKATQGAGRPAPDWLTTWWKVNYRGKDLYYVFGKDRQVKRTLHSPLAANQPPRQAESGSFSVGVDGRITTSWSRGPAETFTHTGWGRKLEETMAGTNALHESLYAQSLF